jgi:hypothetical protein
VVKYFKDQSPFVNDLEGDVNVESDCEGDSPEIEDELLEEELKEGQTRAVLMTGSFSAYVHIFIPRISGRDDGTSSWKSLFFYRCTDSILFAPLKSQEGNIRSDFIREKTVEEHPPPCSPKSIYVIADLVG